MFSYGSQNDRAHVKILTWGALNGGQFGHIITSTKTTFYNFGRFQFLFHFGFLHDYKYLIYRILIYSMSDNLYTL